MVNSLYWVNSNVTLTLISKVIVSKSYSLKPPIIFKYIRAVYLKGVLVVQVLFLLPSVCLVPLLLDSVLLLVA